MLLILDSLFDRNIVPDVLRATVLDENVPVKQRHFLVLEHIFSISTTVHKVRLGDDTDGPRARRIELLSQL